MSGLADLNVGDFSIVAEDQEQSVFRDAVRKITDVDGVGHDLRENSVVRGDSRLASVHLCEGES